MIARSLISEEYSPLYTSFTEEEAKDKMVSYQAYHLPVICNDNKFCGLISFEELQDFDDPSKTLKDSNEKLVDIKVFAHQHIFEVYEKVFSENVSCIAVVDESNNYIGMILSKDLMNHFAKISSFQTNGAIIVLRVLIQDYTLTQIAQIVEENNSKILSLFTSDVDDSSEIEITIKLNTQEISSILQTFSRYEYNVKTYFEGYDKLQELYKDRIDSLLNYLNT